MAPLLLPARLRNIELLEFHAMDESTADETDQKFTSLKPVSTARVIF
jgi:hypothetical protein